jgi:hypothetical protein
MVPSVIYHSPSLTYQINSGPQDKGKVDTTKIDLKKQARLKKKMDRKKRFFNSGGENSSKVAVLADPLEAIRQIK